MNPETTFDFRKRIPALDGLRGVAILMVFFRHYAGGMSQTASSTGLRLIGHILNFGWSGVDLFFVLSGFLITGILFDTAGRPAYYKNFYVRRVLRIFPPYYLLAIAYLILTPTLAAHWRWGHLTFLMYLGYPAALIWPSLSAVSPSVHITHLWSICAEEQFYVTWPWAVRRLRNAAAVLRACLVLGGVALALRVAICATKWVDVTWTHDFLGCRMDSLAVGAAIAILMRGAGRERIMRSAKWVFAITAPLVVALCVISKTTDHGAIPIATFGFTMIAVMYGAVLLLALQQDNFFARVLSTPVLRMFGRYSYAMYLFDFPLTVFLSPKREYFIAWTHSFAIGSLAFLLFALLFNLAAAAASFHFVEAPIQRLKPKFNYGTA